MNDDAKKFFGWLLMIIGVLFALLAGGCGLYVIPLLIMYGGSYGGTPPSVIENILLILVFPGSPLLLCYGLFVWGKSLLPKKNDNTQNKNTNE